MNISVVIPVYKNIDLFLKNLVVNMDFLKGCQVIVVDDFSGENITEKIHEIFPSIMVTENTHNLGFSKTVNKGIKEADGEYIILLNSDVRLFDNSFKKGLIHFDDSKVFAVSFAQKEKGGSIVGKNMLFFERGFMNHRKASDLTLGLNGWAEGGACILRQKMIQELVGFDEIYSPFYWEDIDLSYRAYKRGWKVLFDPEIVVEHHHESTIRKYFDKKRITTIAYRNQLFFQWKNITDADLYRQHIFNLPSYIIRAIAKKDWPFIKGFLAALIRLGRVGNERKREIKESTQSDKQILELFK